ncbi:Uncharacterized protein FWK35_00031637, partial [Aphis craccivora]
LLNRSELLKLQDLEWSIFEIIERKTKIVKPLVLQKINQIATSLKSNTEVVTRTLEHMTNRVKALTTFSLQYMLTTTISRVSFNYMQLNISHKDGWTNYKKTSYEKTYLFFLFRY